MFTELDLSLENTQSNIEDVFVKSLNILCSDSMTILQNNSKVLKFLTDETLSEELGMLAKSVRMAIKHGRFELLQNIILGIKGQVHKLAALEIKYFDEFETLLRSDIYDAFVSLCYEKHAFISPALKEIFETFNETIKLSPTNAAFAVKTAIDTNEQVFVNEILLRKGLSEEFLRQIYKRFHANFGETIDENLQRAKTSHVKINILEEIFSKAM